MQQKIERIKTSLYSLESKQEELLSKIERRIERRKEKKECGEKHIWPWDNEQVSIQRQEPKFREPELPINRELS